MDDLVKRLRNSTEWYHSDCELKMECADRIEADAKRIAELEVAYSQDLLARTKKQREDIKVLQGCIKRLEGKLAAVEKILCRVAEVDLQKSALNCLVYHLPAGNVHALKEVLSQFAKRDVQSWANQALEKIRS